MTTTYELAGFLDQYDIELSIWSQVHEDRPWFAHMNIFVGDYLVFTITSADVSIPVLASRMSVLATDTLRDFERGQRCMPPDGWTDIQYFSTSST